MFTDFFIEIAAGAEGNSCRAGKVFAVRFGKAQDGAGFFDCRKNGSARQEGVRAGLPVADELAGASEARVGVADQDAAVFLCEAASARSLPAKLCSSTMSCSQSQRAIRFLSAAGVLCRISALSFVNVFMYTIVCTVRGICQMFCGERSGAESAP